MATANLLIPVSSAHGKIISRSNGYFYTRNGKQFYRERLETYQKNQSPKQIWRSQSFSYANKQLSGKLTPEETLALHKEWKAAKQLTPFGSKASTPLGWKKSVLMYEWQLQHPFEPWYEAYLADLSNRAAEKTAAEDVSQYQLKKQIDLLSAQLSALRSRLK